MKHYWSMDQDGHGQILTHVVATYIHNHMATTI
jgi:hypothetical protein